ncbi:hypothetical protein Tco_0347198 [Tanacetum coccineum]
MRVKPSTSASGSQPSCNTKKDKIQQTPNRTAHVQHSKLNANSELKCVKCNGCMLSDNNDLCVLDIISNVNAVGNACPLTRITTTTEVPLRKLTARDIETSKPVVTLVNSRKPRKSKNIVPVSKSKVLKSVSANKKEPSQSWGSIVFDVLQLVYQVENKNSKKNNDMYYLRFTKVIVDYFMAKDQAIPRRNKIFWHYARDDLMFTTIRVISKHQDTQVYDAILPQHLTNQDMLESGAYKTYHAYATGEKTPKPKSSKKKANYESSPKTKPTQASKGKRIKTSAKGVIPAKKKQSATKSKGLTVLSEVALTEAKQMKIALERSKTQKHNSHANGSGAAEGTGVTPGVPDVPSYHSEAKQISWKSSDEEDDDEVNMGNDNDDDADNQDDVGQEYDEQDDDNQDDDDQEHDGQENEEQDDVNEQTNSDNDDDDLVHTKLSTHDEEDKEEEDSDPRVHTPSNYESTDDEESDEEIQGANVEGEEIDEEETNEEDEANELYWDVNVNLEGRDTEMTDAPRTIVQTTQVIEDTHPRYRLRDEAQAEIVDFINKLDDNIKKIIKDQVKEQVKAQVSKILPKIEKIVNEQLEAEVLTRSSNESKISHDNLYKALVDAYESVKFILDTYGETVSFKRRQDDEDKDEEPSAGSNRGSKRRKERKEPESTKDPMQTAKDWDERTHLEFETGVTEDQPDEETSQLLDWFQKPAKPPTLDRDWNKTLPDAHGPVQPWLSSLSQMEDPRESFNKLMDTSLDFSAFVMNWLKVDTLTPELLAGSTFELMKGSCKSLASHPRIEDMLLLLVQGKLTNLTVEERLAFNVSLRMFTRSIFIQRRVEDLHLGFIYQNKDKKNRLMRIDELHKFSDGTLNDVRTALNDRLKGIQMKYLPQTIWRQSDKDKAGAMIQEIDKHLKTRRIMGSLEKFVGQTFQNRRDLPRDIPLDSVVVLRYEKRSKSENKGKVPTEMELVLEQTQQGTSYEVSVSAEGVEELKRKVKIKGEKKEALLTLRQKPERFDTLAGNHVKEILLKLNLPDHRSILTDSKDTKRWSWSDKVLSCYRTSSISDEVLKLKNIKKDVYTRFQRQEHYEHVGPEVTRSQEGKRSQDDEKRLCLVDDLKKFKITFMSSQRYKPKPKVKDQSIHTLMIEFKDYELKTKVKT